MSCCISQRSLPATRKFSASELHTLSIDNVDQITIHAENVTVPEDPEKKNWFQCLCCRWRRRRRTQRSAERRKDLGTSSETDERAGKMKSSQRPQKQRPRIASTFTKRRKVRDARGEISDTDDIDDSDNSPRRYLPQRSQYSHYSLPQPNKEVQSLFHSRSKKKKGTIQTPIYGCPPNYQLQQHQSCQRRCCTCCNCVGTQFQTVPRHEPKQTTCTQTLTCESDWRTNRETNWTQTSCPAFRHQPRTCCTKIPVQLSDWTQTPKCDECILGPTPLPLVPTQAICTQTPICSSQLYNHKMEPSQLCCSGRQCSDPSVCPGSSYNAHVLPISCQPIPTLLNSQYPQANGCRISRRLSCLHLSQATQTPCYVTNETQTTTHDCKSPLYHPDIAIYRHSQSQEYWSQTSSHGIHTRCVSGPHRRVESLCQPCTVGQKCCTCNAATLSAQECRPTCPYPSPPQEPPSSQCPSLPYPPPRRKEDNPKCQENGQLSVLVQECPGLPTSRSYLVLPLGRADEHEVARLVAAAREAARALPPALRVADRPDAPATPARVRFMDEGALLIT